MARLTLIILNEPLAVVRMRPDDALPAWFDWAAWPIASVTRTGDELSIVCPASRVPNHAQAERAWKAIKVQGPLDFALTGILSSLLAPLAQAGVSVFALSTYDTDYVLVRSANLARALESLRGNFEITHGP